MRRGRPSLGLKDPVEVHVKLTISAWALKAPNISKHAVHIVVRIQIIGILRFVIDEVFDLFRRRGQPVQIEARASNEGAAIGERCVFQTLLFELRENECVNRIPDPCRGFASQPPDSGFW